MTRHGTRGEQHQGAPRRRDQPWSALAVCRPPSTDHGTQLSWITRQMCRTAEVTALDFLIVASHVVPASGRADSIRRSPWRVLAPGRDLALVPVAVLTCPGPRLS
jgi:hypothetical protein